MCRVCCCESRRISVWPSVCWIREQRWNHIIYARRIELGTRFRWNFQPNAFHVYSTILCGFWDCLTNLKTGLGRLFWMLGNRRSSCARISFKSSNLHRSSENCNFRSGGPIEKMAWGISFDSRNEGEGPFDPFTWSYDTIQGRTYYG
jgi:hypothetical protein